MPEEDNCIQYIVFDFRKMEKLHPLKRKEYKPDVITENMRILTQMIVALIMNLLWKVSELINFNNSFVWLYTFNASLDYKTDSVGDFVKKKEILSYFFF